MGATTRLLLPYPELTDPADVPLDIKELADRLELLVNVPTVTSLPGSPVNGQEVYYVADATNGVVWHLKYRSASASAYKWEFVGGGDLFVRTNVAMETVADGAAWHNPATTDVALAVPLGGDYLAHYGANMDAAAPEGTGIIFQNIINASTAGQDQVTLGPDVIVRSNNLQSNSQEAPITGWVGGRSLRTVYKCSSGAGRRGYPHLRVTPIRCG